MRPKRQTLRLIFALSVLLVVCPRLLPAAEFELRLVKNSGGKPIAMEVAGLVDEDVATLSKIEADDPAWARILAVYVAGEAPRGDIPPMLGAYSVGKTTLRFTPKYALKPGLRYRVTFQPAAVRDPRATAFPVDRLAVVYFTVPAAERGEPTKVAAVYPSAATLPENQLRFYLHFSAPMSRGEAYEQIQLLDEHDRSVKYPFLEIGEELWDSGGTRLTLLIDPGRIKRGLRPREEDGPVLEAGKKYKLIINKRWHDASGRPLASRFEKQFTVGDPIEKALDTDDWKVETPAAGSKKPLVIRFPAPLDRALLERTITVLGSGGKPINGQVTIADKEQTWKFIPEAPWAVGSHELAIDKTLEDLVGNRIGVPFEVDQTGPIEKEVKSEIHRLPFFVDSAAQ